MNKKMKLYYAAIGLAVVAGAGAGPAYAQTVITREVVNPAVDTVVTQQPAGTVITRQPVATVPAETVVEQPYETVETIQTTRPARTITRRVTTSQVTTARHAATPRKSARTVRRSTIRSASLSPAQQRTIYSVIRRERVVPAQIVTERVVTAPVQRVVTAPAYPPPAYIAPGYEPAPYTEAVPEPRYRRYGEWSDSDRYYDSDAIMIRPISRSGRRTASRGREPTAARCGGTGRDAARRHNNRRPAAINNPSLRDATRGHCPCAKRVGLPLRLCERQDSADRSQYQHRDGRASAVTRCE